MSRTPWGLHEDRFLCQLALRSASADRSSWSRKVAWTQLCMGWRVESCSVEHCFAGGLLQPWQRQGVSREAQGVETEGRGAGGRFSCAVPCLAVLWAGRERVGDDGMAFVSGKWVPEGEVGGQAHIFSPALPVGRPFKPSISPTSSTRSQVMKSAVLPGLQLLIHLKLFRDGYCRFEPCPILAAPFKPILQTSCFTAHMQEWQIWPDI
jgi:hypothetical protein